MEASGEICLSSTMMRRMPVLAQSQPTHNYTITQSTNCSAADAFSYFAGPNGSAPGAPATTEGSTAEIDLPGITSPNPISQDVNPSTYTITNTTLPTHVFYPGTVQLVVTPTSNTTSTINITGTGSGNFPIFNDLVGILLFGSRAAAVGRICQDFGSM